MLRRVRRQAQLLDRYWTALRTRGRSEVPPEGLDPEIAELAARLAQDVDLLGPSDAFRADLRRRLQTRATVNQDE